MKAMKAMNRLVPHAAARMFPVGSSNSFTGRPTGYHLRPGS
jgi:hypothetical protein